jgi:hypothetical protein
MSGYNPDEPRVGSGPEAGEWTSGGGGDTSEQKTYSEKDFADAGITLTSKIQAGPYADTSDKIGDPIALYNQYVKMDPQEFKEQFAGKTLAGDPNFKMQLAATKGNALDVQVSVEGKVDLLQSRIAIKSEDTRFPGGMSLEEFQVAPTEQGRGLGKEVLASQVALTQKLGGDHISLRANIDVGGYAWAKYGFTPYPQEWDEIRKNSFDGMQLKLAAIKEENPDISSATLKVAGAALRTKGNNDFATGKIIGVVADLNESVTVGGKSMSMGKALLLGTQWDGSLDFKDESSMTRFKSYVG